MAKREVAERIDGQLAVEVRAPSHRLADANRQRDAANGPRRALRSLVLSIGSPYRMQARRPARAATARGVYPSLLADFGLVEALRAQAARAAVHVSLIGGAPRGSEAAEEAVYFACSEAIQNAAKHAGRGTQVALRLHHDQGSLAVRIADDGRGFDLAHTPEGAGVQNIRDRVEDLGGRFEVASSPGHGTVVTISLPWPAAADRRR